MTTVAVSGAAGRMGSLCCDAVESTSDLELIGRYAPGHGFDDSESLRPAEVIVEFGPATAALENVRRWHSFGGHVVVGSSGFDRNQVDNLRHFWGEGPGRCLVVPNFSIGAVLMMWLAEKASPYFTAAEVIELHHDRKTDAPSGTALATAERMKPNGARAVESTESVPGARGAEVGGVWVHSVRLPGLLAHQEVLFGNPGETLELRHNQSDRSGYVPGILLAIRSVETMADPVTVGLEGLLGL
ncbi:MAG TPA: 4-hydroxy-tetrahydrodipicolinate reductase [Acidimicrobiia bacterium]|nr:4-hydroxy-tetrahydrodipicolinate reductase [Acidimicrobiia bacterium]